MIANIRPGILVALKTGVVGGVEYLHVDLDPEANAPEGGAVSTKKTTRIVADVEEHATAGTIRDAARGLISRICVRTDFGLLCVADREAELDEAIAAAQKLIREHNASASFSRIEFFTVKGRIAETDDEAARGIAAEVRELLEAMDAGVASGDPKAVREAAGRAKKLGQLLDETTAGKVADAVAEAREAARVITKRVVDGEEALATVLADIRGEAREAARFAFLDVEPATEIAEPTADAAPEMEVA